MPNLIWNVSYDNKSLFTGPQPNEIFEYPLETFVATLKTKMDNTYHPWLTNKKSKLCGAGYGLFVATNFRRYDIIGIYMGETFDLNKEDTKEYAISSATKTIDAMGGINSGYPWYWGLHFASYPNNILRGFQGQWTEKQNKIKYNAILYENFNMYATKAIQKGQEIYLVYKYTTI